MKLRSLEGKYVLAVSGGVDSMVLLDILSKQPAIDLSVAHFDHGIRPESAGDAEMVQTKTLAYKLPFYLGQAKLGASASEDAARRARYGFLNKLKIQTGAKAIITAHHQDDLIETAILNIIRGTGPAGLVAMLNNQQVVRPLLNTKKTEILAYAKSHQIIWVEDSTNANTTYLRNYVRSYVSANLSSAQRNKILKNIYKIQELSRDINALTEQLSNDVLEDQTTLKRSIFTSLPTAVGNEFLYKWLKQAEIVDIDRKIVQRLALAIKTAKPNTAVDIKNGARLEFTPKNAQIRTP